MISRILIAVLLVAASQTAQAGPTFPLGSRVGLDVPADLKGAVRFQGFEDPDRKVVVEVLDVPPASYDQILGSIFANDQGARNIKRETFPYRSGIGYLVSGEITEDGKTSRLYFLLGAPVGSPGESIVGLIRVVVPESARDTYGDDRVRAMLASMTFRDTPVDEQLGQLPYSVKDLAGFRIFRVAPPATLLLIDGDGSDLARQAHVIVAIGQGTAATADERARAARSLMASAPFRDITLQMAEPMRLAGAPAYEIRAEAETGTGQPVTLVQWVRFGSGGYMQIVGVSPRDAWEQVFPRFRTVRDAIGPR